MFPIFKYLIAQLQINSRPVNATFNQTYRTRKLSLNPAITTEFDIINRVF